MKVQLRDEYRAAKKARIERNKIASVATHNDRAHLSALFAASFANVRVVRSVLAYQGADANLLPPRLLEQVFLQEKVKVMTLRSPRTYKTISGDTCVKCDRVVTLNIQLKIRHGTNLSLSNVECEVPRERIESAILGRRVLESIGCDNLAMLEAARNRNDGDIDVASSLKSDEESTEGIVAALFGESLYHTGIDGEDGLENVDEKSEFGNDSDEVIAAVLKKIVDDAAKNGLSLHGKRRLKNA